MHLTIGAVGVFIIQWNWESHGGFVSSSVKYSKARNWSNSFSPYHYWLVSGSVETKGNLLRKLRGYGWSLCPFIDWLIDRYYWMLHHIHRYYSKDTCNQKMFILLALISGTVVRSLGRSGNKQGCPSYFCPNISGAPITPDLCPSAHLPQHLLCQSVSLSYLLLLMSYPLSAWFLYQRSVDH